MSDNEKEAQKEEEKRRFPLLRWVFNAITSAIVGVAVGAVLFAVSAYYAALALLVIPVGVCAAAIMFFSKLGPSIGQQGKSNAKYNNAFMHLLLAAGIVVALVLTGGLALPVALVAGAIIYGILSLNRIPAIQKLSKTKKAIGLALIIGAIAAIAFSGGLAALLLPFAPAIASAITTVALGVKSFFIATLLMGKAIAGLASLQTAGLLKMLAFGTHGTWAGYMSTAANFVTTGWGVLVGAASTALMMVGGYFATKKIMPKVKALFADRSSSSKTADQPQAQEVQPVDAARARAGADIAGASHVAKADAIPDGQPAHAAPDQGAPAPNPPAPDRSPAMAAGRAPGRAPRGGGRSN